MTHYDYPGVYISFEGGEGAGKTTQIFSARDYFQLFNIETLLTKEPGNAGDYKGKIRALLLDPDHEKVSPYAELFLYAADRNNHVNNVVMPALQKGNVVISDRGYDSTTAYQGYGRGLDLETVTYINSIAREGLSTNLTFFLDLDPKIGLARSIREEFGETQDRLESEAIEFHEKVRHGFYEISRQEPERLKIIDASNSKEDTFEQIKYHLDQVIEEKFSYSRNSLP